MMQNLARMSVLIVEGDTAQNRSIAELTTELGVRDIVRVYTSQSALSWLCSRGFDVMLCAEQLGAEDGVQLARDALRVSPATRSVLVRAEGVTGALPMAEVESLERPISAEKLGELLQRARDPRGGLWCEVPELSLSDILQMYHLGRRSISILLSGPVAGRIYLHSGDIVDAESGALRGLPALSLLLEASSGLLRTDTTHAEPARTITLPFEHAIFEATRLLDERRRDARPSDVPAPRAENVSTVQQLGAAQQLGTAQQLGAAQQLDTAQQSGTVQHSEESLILPLPSVEGAAPFAFATPTTKGKAPLMIAASVVGALVLLGTAGIYFANRAIGPKPTQVVSSLHPQPAPPEGTSHTSLDPAPGGSATSITREPMAARADAGPSPEGAAAAAPPAEQVEELPPTFELSILSKPPRAIVKEGNKVLGRTPLKLTIARESVAKGPRQFLLLMKGYRPYTLSQAESKADARMMAVLAPRRRPVAATELKGAVEPAAGASTNKPDPDSNLPLRH